MPLTRIPAGVMTPVLEVDCRAGNAAVVRLENKGPAQVKGCTVAVQYTAGDDWSVVKHNISGGPSGPTALRFSTIDNLLEIVDQQVPTTDYAPNPARLVAGGRVVMGFNITHLYALRVSMMATEDTVIDATHEIKTLESL